MNKYRHYLLGFFSISLLVAGLGLNMLYAPHRDVQSVPVFASLSVEEFVNEFLDDATTAASKYLSADGDSKIVELSGTIESITTNQNNETVIYLTGNLPEVGAQCTLLENQTEFLTDLNEGDQINIKGQVSAGASYDADFELYEDAILQHCYF